ncbi:MAG: alpha-L-fucosidase [Chitinophagaceae bacterium]
MPVKKLFIVVCFLIAGLLLNAQSKRNSFLTKTAAAADSSSIEWFRNAKFGLFVHWGLYSHLGGEWRGKKIYGSGEWIMNQLKIPAKEYEKTAGEFNPKDFDAAQWAQLAKDAGAKYMVVTAKHHEGFAMYESHVSPFNIVNATPYRKDPMKPLAEEIRKRGLHFGFYYSQFEDWHEPNGGGNDWDFDESKKDYQKYYREKSIPQVKEIMSNYGPLGIVWFDLPGGLDKEQTQTIVDTLRRIQPNALFSSRIGHDLGDYQDFGDSEIPATPITKPWEAVFTSNDTWGYINHDLNFKSSSEIIQLLVKVASKGGNLMLNLSPDGLGRIPAYSISSLKKVGEWLKKNGESIYGSTYGFIPAQPWGVTTSKPGKLFLHILNRPDDGKILIPGFKTSISDVHGLNDRQSLWLGQDKFDVWIDITKLKATGVDDVVVVEYNGKQQPYDSEMSVTVSHHFKTNELEAATANKYGNSSLEVLTWSHYFGDWKHASVITNMATPADSIDYKIRVIDPGEYKLVLEYACPEKDAMQEGVISFAGKEYLFKSLQTTNSIETEKPVLFIRHSVAVITISKPGVYSLVIRPNTKGNELLKLKSISIEPSE